MKRSYDIGGRTVTLRSNVHTWFVYKAQFGAEMIEDIQRAIALDKLREAAKSETEGAAVFGEECRLFLQVFWAFADEGTEGLPPFNRWLKTVGGVDMPDIVKTITELYESTLKPDRKNRSFGEDGGTGGSMMTTEELAEMLFRSGADTELLKDMTVGMAINLVHACVNSARRAKGEDVPDREEQYKALKEAKELIDSGQVTDYDPEDYERVAKLLKEWENG